MTGMTPAWLTLSGRNCLVPPKTRRPRTCLADWVGIRRWPLVMAMTPTTTATNSADQHDQFLEADLVPRPPPSVKTEALKWSPSKNS